MKYPQLVSTQAVNAISDWLVSRLEELGVDAPLVYSRLLLSLLHTPLQINALDLAEVSTSQLNIKKCLGSKIGRRLTTHEVESLKRFAAIESLMDATATDEIKTEIEELVDELCEKLHEIERQSNIDNDITILKTITTTTSDKLKEEPTIEDTASSKFHTNTAAATTASLSSPVDDPTRRYYRAFPSLSKELETKSEFIKKSVLIPLTWPPTAGKTASIMMGKKCAKNETLMSSSSASNNGVKRRPKRRRNNTNNFGSKNQFSHRKSNSVSEDDNTSEKSCSLWDTNFEGSWEMGDDLIREFLLKQNKRNHSISENEMGKIANIAARNEYFPSKLQHDDVDRDNAATASTNDDDYNADDDNAVTVPQYSEPNIVENITHLNILKDEGYATPDTFISFCELADLASSKHANSMAALEPRRLYERDILNGSVDPIENENFALFEAKFNQSVEALWNNNEKEVNGKDTTIAATTANNKNDLNMFWSNYYKHQYKPTVAETTVVVDPLTEYRNNVGVDCISRLLDASPTLQQQCVIKRSGFIEAGTNLQSSIWSNNHDNVGARYDGGLRDLWDKMETRRNDNIIADNGSEYSLENAVKFSKWSECPYEPPFVPQSVAAAENENHEIHGQPTAYKSLPILGGCAPKTSSSLASSSSSICIDIAASTQQNSEKSTAKPKPVPSKMTLPNHSEFSGFCLVYPKTVNNYDYYDRQYKNGLEINRKRYAQERALAEDENLLVSDRTHFRPIKQTYVDGYTFDIPYILDDVKYKRSETGSLYFESEKYMEYKMFDRTAATGAGKWANTFRDPFVLKFCVKQNEKYCQTDDCDEGNKLQYNSHRHHHQHLNDTMIMNRNHEDLEIGMEYELQNEQTRILNYCICYERKLEEIGDDDDDGDDETDMIGQINNNNNNECGKLSNAICAVHPLTNAEIENWSLHTIKASCLNNEHMHTLWGHCTTCNNDIKSLPANRLMKDELSADGDEIMSDLKYMQDLFIGAGGGGGGEEEGWENEVERVDTRCIATADDDDDEMDDVKSNSEENNSFRYKEEQLAVSSGGNIQVNKLIADLLKPETAKSITEILGPRQSKSILEEIAMREKSQSINNSSDWYNLKHLHSPPPPIPEMTETGYFSTDKMFNIWKKHDDSQAAAAEWENSKNLKAEIESTDKKRGDDHNDDDKMRPVNNNNKDQQFEVIRYWSNNNNNNDIRNDICELNIPIYLDIFHEDNQKNRFNNAFSMVKNSFCNNNNNNNNNIILNGNNITSSSSILTTSSSVKKRSDRKRRHSASQNLSDDFKLKGKFGCDAMMAAAAAAAAASSVGYGGKERCDITATVITCKYWPKNHAATNFPSKFEETIDMSPSSILNHVTMVSRPLTR